MYLCTMIELFANRFYYSVYCSVVKFAHAMDFIARPLKWLFATFFWFVPCLRKRLQRQGKTREKVIQEAMSITMDGVSMKTKKDYGIAYLLDADDVIDTFFFFFTSSLIMIPQLFIPFRYVRYIVTNIWLFLAVILFCIFSAQYLAERLMRKNDKYKDYFKRFDKYKKKERRHNHLISLGVAISVLSVWCALTWYCLH